MGPTSAANAQEGRRKAQDLKGGAGDHPHVANSSTSRVEHSVANVVLEAFGVSSVCPTIHVSARVLEEKAAVAADGHGGDPWLWVISHKQWAGKRVGRWPNVIATLPQIVWVPRHRVVPCVNLPSFGIDEDWRTQAILDTIKLDAEGAVLCLGRDCAARGPGASVHKDGDTCGANTSSFVIDRAQVELLGAHRTRAVCLRGVVEL